MRGPWLSSVFHVMQHTLLYVACLAFLVLGAAYGSAVAALAERVIPSKFVLHVLVFMEYAAVVADAAYLLMHLVRHLVESFGRVMRSKGPGEREEEVARLSRNPAKSDDNVPLPPTSLISRPSPESTIQSVPASPPHPTFPPIVTPRLWQRSRPRDSQM